jgi:hypothetical protein
MTSDDQINTDGADDVAQTATDMTPLELSYFRELVSDLIYLDLG